MVPAELSTILADRFMTVRKDGADLSLEKHSGRGIHSFLMQIALGVELIPSQERLILFRVQPNIMVHLMHLLFSVWVDLYLTSRRLFA